MKKNIIKCIAFLFCLSVIAISCTDEENSVPTTSESGKFIEKSGSGINEFKSFLENKYGAAYKVGQTPVVVNEPHESYKVFKVTLTGNMEGYILETSGDGNYYLEHDKQKGVVTTSYYSNYGLRHQLTDISGDPYYNYHGLNPIIVKDPVVQPARFWGWKITRYGQCGPCANGPCAGVYVTHYIFGIGGKEKQLQDAAGHNVSVDCDPGPPPTHEDYEGALKF